MEALMHILEHGVFFPEAERTSVSIGEDDAITGECTFDGTVGADTRAIPFALSADGNVPRVALDAKSVPVVALQPGVWSVQSPHGLDLSSHHTVRIAYSGTLRNGVMTATDGGKWYELQCQATWKPLFSLDAHGRSRATVRLELRLPASFKVVGGDSQAYSRQEDEKRAFCWDTGAARCSDFSVVTGQGRLASRSTEGIKFRALTMSGALYTPDEAIDAAQDVLVFHQSMLGPYPFRSLSLACPPRSLSGNCARHGLVIAGMMTDRSPLDVKGYPILAHEISHMWWGSSVMHDSSKIGFMEPLASYSAIRAVRHRFSDSDYVNWLATVIGWAKTAEESGTPLLECTWSTPYSGWLREGKGSCAMLQLEKQMGTDKMDAALHSFVDRFKGRFAEPHDLRDALVGFGGPEVGEMFDAYFTRTEPVPDSVESYII